ncbi:MAG TPA: FemAB family XrtA/PEP-CTERM system-associated protein [Desulfuromonadales bacterium]|nr:FemAB family XrtA/PEP-CTERM system-associated protein [Desulfuromonadales bacterium]
MRIRLANDRDQSAWDAFVLNHPDGLAYHQYGWKKAVEQAYGFQGAYLLAERGGDVCGVLPMIHLKTPLFAGRLVSLPYCDVGGCLACDAEISEALLRAASDFAAGVAAKGPELRWAGLRNAASASGAAAGQKVRMLLDLPGDSGRLLAGLKSKLRSQVKKPQRDGLRARLGGTELIDDFYGVFAQNMRLLGSPVHSKRWIEAVVEIFAGRARVGVVYTQDGAPAAGGILLLHPRTVSIPWASSLRSCNHLNPNMLLYWTFLAFAADGGYEKFDFGRSTPGEGTYRFKEQWGAKPSPLCWQDLTAPESTGITGNWTATGRRFAEMLWSCLPLRVTTLLGPPLRRNISL